MKEFPFVAGSYEARSTNFDCQRTVNLYAEMSGSGLSKTIAMLVGTPGTVRWSNDFTLEPVRAGGMLRFSSSIMIAVGATQVVKYDASANGTRLGYINFGMGPVSMASNGTVIMLVTGPDGYFIDPVLGTITQIVDPAFVGADKVDFINGYFVFNKRGTQQYQWIGPYSTVIDPLAFASAEGAPDLLVSLIVDHEQVLLIGETTAEFHAPSGDADQPFQPVQGAQIEQGCAAAFSVAKITDGTGAGTVLWLTRNEAGQGMVVRTAGYQPLRISNHAVEFAIASYGDVSDAIAYTYQQEGHNFYMLTFPSADKTWCYDLATELWHERMSTDVLDGAGQPGSWTNHRHRSNCHVFFAGKNLIGDFETGEILYFDLNRYSDNQLQDPAEVSIGYPIIAIRQCPHLAVGDAWQVFWELWIDMETGVGLNDNKTFIDGSAAGKDPMLLLEWSDDGGKSFPNSRLIPIGKIGETKTRALARRLGKSRDRVFRASLSAPVKRAFLDAGVRTSIEARRANG